MIELCLFSSYVCARVHSSIRLVGVGVTGNEGSIAGWGECTLNGTAVELCSKEKKRREYFVQGREIKIEIKLNSKERFGWLVEVVVRAPQPRKL
jgi:hypothetical protein